MTMPCSNTQAEIDRDTPQAVIHDYSYRNSELDDLPNKQQEEADYEEYKKAMERLLNGEVVVGRDRRMYSLEESLIDQKWAYYKSRDTGCSILGLHSCGLLSPEQSRLVNLEARVVAALIVG